MYYLVFFWGNPVGAIFCRGKKVSLSPGYPKKIIVEEGELEDRKKK